MNPFLLSGPTFLLLFGLAAAFVFLLAFASDLLLRSPNDPLSRAELEALGPYELAYLVGGRDMAAEAAVVSLGHASYLSIDERGRVARGGEPRSRVGAHAYRRIAVDLLPIERAVFRAVADGPASIGTIRLDATGSAETLEVALVQRGLLLDPLRRVLGAGLGTCWLGVALWFVGAMRMLRGVSDGYHVGFLVLLMVPLTAFVFMRRRRFPRTTYRGEVLLRQLRMENAALRTTAMSEPAQLEARELALAYGLFGATVLTGELLPFARAFVFGRVAVGSLADGSSASIETSDGFSCAAVGGGCGSSCGAGCGGCGGCGS